MIWLTAELMMIEPAVDRQCLLPHVHTHILLACMSQPQTTSRSTPHLRLNSEIRPLAPQMKLQSPEHGVRQLAGRATGEAGALALPQHSTPFTVPYQP
jgi:hypothetical protein